MEKLGSILVLIFVFNWVKSQDLTDSDFVPGEFLVMASSKQNVLDFIEKVNSSSHSYPTLTFKEVVGPELGVYSITFDAEKTNQLEFLNYLRNVGGVLAIQNNHYVSERVVPNDSLFPQMWAMQNTGQNGGTIGADISATQAWEISTGGLTATGDTIVVAVIDGGFYLNHIDLNFWKNYAEIPNDGIDNDGNGYIDDFNGWNAYNNVALNSSSNSHGTHVAGTIGAKGNNTVGVTGVNWNVKIMPVAGSSETESVVVRGYNYILKQRKIYNRTNGDSGAFVVSTNASFGKDFGQPANFPIWCAVYDSLGKEGILSVGATANINIDVDVQGDIPTTCSSQYLIGVTNTTRNDVRYGQGAAWGAQSIELGAPGTSIISTYPNDGYSISTGTSMAAPHVAGAIGLMFSAASPEQIELYKQKPDSMALVFKDWLLCGVDVKPDLVGKTVTGGRLNLYNALNNVISDNSCLTAINKTTSKTKSKLELFSIYPNPGNGEVLNISYYAQSTQLTLQIFNLLGFKVLEKHLHISSIGYKSHNVKIDQDELSEGVYFVRISDEVSESNCLPYMILK